MSNEGRGRILLFRILGLALVITGAMQLWRGLEVAFQYGFQPSVMVVNWFKGHVIESPLYETLASGLVPFLAGNAMVLWTPKRPEGEAHALQNEP